MKKISEEETKTILEASAEGLNLEFKSTFDFDNDWARERLIRSILAISNTRNGGYVIIGVEEQSDKTFLFKGVSNEHLEKLRSKIEDLKSQVESFSTSPVLYEISEGINDNNSFVIINISEFRRTPTICRKNGKHPDKILEEGSVYIRTLKDKPSSVKLTNPVDIQDLFERSVDKEISHLHGRGWQHSSSGKKKDIDSLFKSESNDF